MSSKPQPLSTYEKTYIIGKLVMYGAVNAKFEQGHLSQSLIDRLIDTGRMIRPQESIDAQAQGRWNSVWYALTPAGVESIYSCGLLDAEQLADAKRADAAYGKPTETAEATPETAKTNDSAAVSDNPDATLTQVLDAAAKQDRVHPRDVSFIMDGLLIRQCRAFVNHDCFPFDSASDKRAVGWALKLGLIDARSGKFTSKGKAFLAEIC